MNRDAYKGIGLKTVVWGFRQHKQTINLLEDQNVIEVIEWIGGDKPKCNLHGENIYLLEFKDKPIHPSFRSLYLDLYEKVFLKFSFMCKRHDKNNMKNIFDARDIFSLSFNYFLNLLVEKEIEFLIMSNIPHEGFDFLLYEIAKALKIKTLVFYQSVIPNYYYCVKEVENFGVFNKSAPVLSRQKECSEYFHNVQQQPFYVKNIQKYNVTILKVIKYLIRNKSPQMYWNFLRFKKYKHDLYRLTTVPNFLDRYVYFPLQLNPELTTMPLGEKFDDQLLAIEYLSSLLPDSTKIYVKENPKQTEQMRGEYFFRRISRLHNVVIVPSDTNTFELIKSSLFVANVTGTVGWEAIRMGKNCLVFGWAWYRSLPGVFEYNENLKIEDVINNHIDINELEKKLSKLLTKLGHGVIDPVYVPTVKNFDNDENIRGIVKVIKSFIEDDK